MPSVGQTIEEWLRGSTTKRLSTTLSALDAVIATDIGLKREDNQDCVAAIRYSDGGGRPVLCFAVVDGMGGMQDGAECARLTLASFFEALVASRREHLSEGAVEDACKKANEAVFTRWAGKGGATLSAVCFDSDDFCFTANIGDSRIYGAQEENGNKNLVRLSIDDNLHEAFGGSGQELMQFVGIGKGLVPHVKRLDQQFSGFILTTDGVHFLQNELLGQIYRYAPDLKATTERLLALARWHGGPDNATVAAIKLGHRRSEWQCSKHHLQLWGLTGELHIYKDTSAPALNRPEVSNNLGLRESRRRTKVRSAKKAKDQVDAPTKQLNIEIEIGGKQSDENR